MSVLVIAEHDGNEQLKPGHPTCRDRGAAIDSATCTSLVAGKGCARGRRGRREGRRREEGAASPTTRL